MMRVRSLGAFCAVIALALTACGTSSNTSDNFDSPADAAGTLKVWLMEGSVPQPVVDAVNAQFNTKYPNVKVKVEVQQWSGVQDKLTTSLWTPATPCVAELGNTQVAKYADAGLLANLTPIATSLGSANWLAGMQPPGMLNGQRFSIPFYGGDRVVVYNKAQFAKAGVSIPKTMDELNTVAARLTQVNGTPANGYSAFYFPGKFMYGALPFIWEFGGEIAVQDAQGWKGTLDGPAAQKGLTQLNDLVQKYSTAPKDGDETKNYVAFQQGNVGMVLDAWWAPDAIVKAKPAMKDDVGVFALPGLTAQKTANVFLGGSDLGVSQHCETKGLAADWIKLMTDTANQTLLAKQAGVIPNQEAAFAGHAGNPYLQVSDQAAQVSKFTPVSPNWANVESQNVLPDMLVRIFTRQATIPDATRQASQQLTTLLNAD